VPSSNRSLRRWSPITATPVMWTKGGRSVMVQMLSLSGDIFGTRNVDQLDTNNKKARIRGPF
jgi:hypothetical protein